MLPNAVEPATEDAVAWDDEGVEDDRLRLIFTCCHPALPAGGPGSADAARGVRPHDRGDRARLPDRCRPRSPSGSCAPRPRSATRAFPIRCHRVADLPDRLDSVLRVVYLVFNEGYSASSGASLTRHDLSGEAIRLGRLLVELLPEPEAVGLLALMLLQESRRAARTSPAGELVLLDGPGPLALEPGSDRARGWRWWSGRCRRAGSAPTRSRRRSRRYTPRRPTPPPRTGPRSSDFTTCWRGPIRRPWSS